jgi:23S rRNA pseudouridine1911/1915/1917 synthase
MHCAPLKNGSPPSTLLEWYAGVFPPVREFEGRREGEGGLLHRLDFETCGLVLFAKTRAGLEHILAEQKAGAFVKEYSSLCRRTGGASRLPGFPPTEPLPDLLGEVEPPFGIESFFRPFGRGRKEVRPVTGGEKKRRGVAGDCGGFYRTEIIGAEKAGTDLYRFTLRLKRGFRHQIRCHLAWKGCPILNDPLYGPDARPADTKPAGGTGETTREFLALRAQALFFTDRGGKTREYRIGSEEF